jgi:hypothetical protein
MNFELLAQAVLPPGKFLQVLNGERADWALLAILAL